MAKRQLWTIAAVQVLAMALWFSASAVSQDLSREWSLGSTGESLLTTSVQLGFVVGAIASAVLSLADRLPPHLLMAAAAAAGTALNAVLALTSDGLGSGLPLRFLTGVSLAGVYPVGMKIMTTWFTTGRGLALRVMVGGAHPGFCGSATGAHARSALALGPAHVERVGPGRRAGDPGPREARTSSTAFATL